MDFRDKQAAPKKQIKQEKDTDFLNYYNKLKVDVSEAEWDAALILSTAQATTKAEAVQNILHIDKELKNKKRNLTMTYARLGEAYAVLKRMYYFTCAICTQSSANTYSVLACPRCAQASVGNSFLQDLETVAELPSYSNSYINFLITFASICSKYPLLVNIPWDASQLRKYMFHYLPDQLEADRHLWAPIQLAPTQMTPEQMSSMPMAATNM